MSKNKPESSTTSSTQSQISSNVSGYERIKVVGKGSFGSAILYRRKDDDSLVVIKEINMLELSTTERQLALNEVALLSRMDHPHIISYYDSFEQDGTLMIEMEYADGGTLAQFLARRQEYVAESEIMYMFEQMLSAVAYLHDNNVLHRDLKTANIFLTREKHVKIGDFGISKIMGTETRLAGGAQTVVGTPYYISPEMCEGKSYNVKSDIWALGCVLYEMACLQKTFEGSNLPALIGKIVKADYEQIKGPYSNDLKLLVRDMLQVNPEDRPSAEQALMIVTRKHGKKGNSFGNRRLLDKDPRNCYSALYEFDVAPVTLMAVPNLPPKIRVKQLAVGPNHQALLTFDNVVYAWGENRYGELGVGDRRPRPFPTHVDALDGKDINKIAVGAHFSVFCGDRGIAMVCGHRKYLGNGKSTEDWLKPRLIDSLLREDIVDLSAGDEHTAAVCGEGKVFVWGSGEYGQLGTGNTDHVYSPKKIEVPAHLFVINVKCGPDCTALITSCGTMIAMGSNRFNKLNLNTRMGFFSHLKRPQQEVENIVEPKVVKAFQSRIVDVSLSSYHSGVLLENGHVHVFGRNKYGELGLGHRQTQVDAWLAAYRPVKALCAKTCVQLVCGNGFTMVATGDNELYFWGTRGIKKKTNETVTIEDLEIERSSSPGEAEKKSQRDSANAKDRSKSAKKHWPFSKNQSIEEESEDDICSTPTLCLRLESTRNSSGNKPFIKLSQLCGNGKRVLVVINTAPSQQSDPEQTNKFGMMTMDTTKRRRSAPELQATETPTWVQNELNEAEVLSYSHFMSGKKNGSKAKNNKEKQLRAEIEKLKQQVHQQSKTFKGHESQMALLQQKLAELQALHTGHVNEPPPAYPQSAKGRSSSNKPRIIRNPFTPEAIPSKACNIL